MNHNQSGKLAELLAAMYFIVQGFWVVRRNFITGRGTGAGEIDLIVRRGKLLVFVEVKKRSDLERAAYAIAPEQQRRIWRAAENFIKNNPQYSDYNLRFDAFLVGKRLRCSHISDAWRCE